MVHWEKADKQAADTDIKSTSCDRSAFCRCSVMIRGVEKRGVAGIGGLRKEEPQIKSLKRQQS